MRTSLITGALCCALIVAAIILAGCTQAASSTTTPSPTVPPETTLPSGMPAVTATAVMTTPATAMTPVPSPSMNSVTTIFVNSSSNGDILTIPASDRVLVRLNENPTTGYTWNATPSKGLAVISDIYYPPNTSLIGAGGYHEWILAPDTVGTYTFKAVYIRPWEGVSSAADSFSLVIVATPT
ncbi:protease inhibitor I42 family protein [Methanoregula sp.]|uniref:protease inhibitor I42 family protein n=1 Tax=Methanoregula sp. TaxID=2052170 RepID=UPI002BF9FBFB|nr:protease inhibitor I42 family protein [Methanoregula sp.]HVP97115.1 protease inhibitor I42 family protein [Methanoregula sp.]